MREKVPYPVEKIVEKVVETTGVTPPTAPKGVPVTAARRHGRTAPVKEKPVAASTKVVDRPRVCWVNGQWVFC